MKIDVDVITCSNEYAIFEHNKEHCLFIGYEDEYSFGSEIRQICKAKGYQIILQEKADRKIVYDQYEWTQYRKSKLENKK